MKRLSIICILLQIACFIPRSVFAIGYCKDFLEPGNPGGWGTSLKTWDEARTQNIGEEVLVDIWINDVPNDSLITAGFYLMYEPSSTIINAEVYDGTNGPPGPWDPGGTTIIPNMGGPGTYFVGVVNFNLAFVDVGGDIIIGRLTIPYMSPGDIEISVGIMGL